ncbi:MAG TPA: hypothetical protein VM734_20080 [Kofleriaceae bacterium]|nr:hypothetical protein [Kofleriaceae bacterium]
MTNVRACLALAVLAACGGGGKTPSASGPTSPDPSAAAPAAPTKPDHAPTDDVATDRLAPAVAPAIQRAPEVFPPRWKAVGVGQQVSFSVAAIDQDLDDVRVDVTAMPKSARFDPITQTVTWKPTKADLPKASFTLQISELPSGKVETRTWELAVTAKKQVLDPPAGPDAAETLFTIHDPARLADTRKAYPFDTMLAHGATLFRATLPPEAQAKLGKLDKAALFRSFLKSMAEIHQNPRLDPDAKEFDKQAFGDAKGWQLVVVRPRIDKKFHELRLVYRAVNAPEPVFAMFRVRPSWDVPTLPAEARVASNQVFAELFATHLLAKDGALAPALVKDKRAHSKAVLAFVKGVLGYQAADVDQRPWARAGFVALPTEARMGGGSARNPDGSYASGDGWAWSVMKPMVSADGTAQAYVNIPIPGFWTQAVPSPDKSAWIGKCAPAFDPDDPKHTAGWEVLCRKALGFVDLPDATSGKVAPSKIDAVNLFRDHKKGPAVALLPLDDGRRDHGEENGMTCAQCHIRNFGVRDYTDPATSDPRAGTPKAPNRALPTLAFQIVPAEYWEAFTLELMQDQECKAKAHLEAALGTPSKLGCALADPAGPRVTDHLVRQ